MPDSSQPLWSLTATSLAEGYRGSAFTPLEAMVSVLERHDTVNAQINAVIALDREGALTAAAESTRRYREGRPLSALDGVPVSVKDNLLVRGLPATWGSQLLAGYIPDRDEPAIALLRAAGALLFGKTNVPEFTIQGYTSNLLFGATSNPHAPGMTPGGSTGGGAAAVAAGIGPVAIGTDGGGSIRRPAAHCGLYSWKPGIGTVPRYGGLPQILADFEVVGAVARSDADLRAIQALLAVYDPRDPRSVVTRAASVAFPSRPRIAYMPRIGSHPVDPQIAEAVDGFVDALIRSGADVTTVEAPFDYDRATAAWGTIMQSGLAWYLSRMPGWQDQIGANAKAVAAQGAAITAADLLDAHAVTTELRTSTGAFFGEYDVLLSPATAALAWPADTAFPEQIAGQTAGPRGHAVYTGWVNVAGLPAATVPLALTTHGGGIGLQVVTAFGTDPLQFIAGNPVFQQLAPIPVARMVESPTT